MPTLDWLNRPAAFTTAAVAHKIGRRWIGIEMGEHAATHCLPRLQKVIDGEQGGISKALNWQGGGGFRFKRLGAPVFDVHYKVDSFMSNKEDGYSQVSYMETAQFAVYLLFNSILKDKRPASGNVLTQAVLDALLVLHAQVKAR